MEGKRGSSYPVLKKLSARPASNENRFLLPGHSKMNNLQSAEIIADHFSKISQEYSPLSSSSLPPNIRDFLSVYVEPPRLSVSAVKSRIVRAKKPMNTVLGHLPKKIVQQFVDELAFPVKMLFDKITANATYPTKWKT